ncbi:MAG TPA: hypothetical protein VII59_12375 [Streptosporangiaceae bacterium]
MASVISGVRSGEKVAATLDCFVTVAPDADGAICLLAADWTSWTGS